MSVTLPPEITFGVVVGRWIRAVADTSGDVDELPEAVPASGTGRLTPVTKSGTRLDSTQSDGTYVGIMHEGYDIILNADGEITTSVNPNTVGITVITGFYNVEMALGGGVSWPSFTIEVTADNTAANPVDLIKWTPIEAAPTVQIVASLETAERAEAAAIRAEAAAETAVGGVATHSALTGLADDDHPQYHTDARGDLRYSPLGHAHDYAPTTHGHTLDETGDTATRLALTPAERAKLANTSGTNTGDQDLSGYATTTALTAGLADKADAAHSHVLADVTDYTPPDLSGYATTASLAAVATTGAYADLSGIPTIPDSPDDIGAAPATQTINAQTGAYTLTASDTGKLVTVTAAAAVDVTVPSGVFTAGQRVDVLDLGAGRVTFVDGPGMTLSGTPSLVSRAQYSAHSIVFLSASSAVVVGDLA